MTDSAAKFRRRLVESGLTDSAISAAWPEWWSESADASPSAQAELRFSIARKLGLDPTSLHEEGRPAFAWDDSAKFKNFTGGAGPERSAITSFGTAVARMLLSGTHEYSSLEGISAGELRTKLLASNRPFVMLEDLLALLWGVGVPVVHLRVYPLAAKRMCAMTVHSGDRFATLLARDARYPASTLFHLAHEVGHIALSHIPKDRALIDMTGVNEPTEGSDAEEDEADQYALELLTGYRNPEIEVRGDGRNSQELAAQALSVGASRQIEPGVLALCYGHSTGNWGVATKALEFIYERPADVWRYVNSVARAQIDWHAMTDESVSFIGALLGGSEAQ